MGGVGERELEGRRENWKGGEIIGRERDNWKGERELEEEREIWEGGRFLSVRPLWY